MKYGLDVSISEAYAQAGLLADLAALAEESGWDGFFVQDCVLAARGETLVDPWVALSAIAHATSRVRIGALMTPLAAYLPWQVARQCVSLDHLSAGRLIFGAGLGSLPDDFVAVGEDPTPGVRAEKLDEGLALLRLFWQGEPFSFTGRRYQIRQAQLLPTPIQRPSIPIWIAGYWPHRKPLRRAAAFDGLYIGSLKADGEPLTPADLREAVAYARSQRQDNAAPFDVVFAGETESASAAGVARAYAEAGATWWLEGAWVERGSPEQLRARIRQGPARVE